MARTLRDQAPSPRSHSEPEHRSHGRRGGTTTVKPRMIRKTVWLDREVEAALRADAYHSGLSEAELVRRALRAAYHLD